VARSRPHYNVTLTVLALAATTYALQQTMVVPALAVLQGDLDTSTTWITWVFTGFLLSAAVLTPILGKLGDRYGKERLLVISLGLFFLGTVGCACAWSVGSLIGFRIASGTGAAVFPLSFGIIRDEFPREKVKVGMGLLSAVFGIGGGFGLVFSGLIVDHLSWRWLFVAGAVPVALATLLVHRYVPESPVRSPSRIDMPGAVLLSGTLVALLLPLTEGDSWGWTSAATLAFFGASLVLATAFVLVEQRVAAPLLDLEVFVERPVLLTNITAVISGFALFGAFSLVPRFIEASEAGYGFGASATRAGLYLVPMSLTMLVAGPVGGVLGRHWGSKWPLSVGMLMIAAASGLLAAWHEQPWQISLAMVAMGVGAAFAFASMPALITDAVEATETGIATGINTVMRTVGGVIGGQVGATILTSATIAGTAIPTERAYSSVFVLAAAAAAVGGIVAALMTPVRRLASAPAPAGTA
jgi:EmrB/QacA subfamily drug resistance transporter